MCSARDAEASGAECLNVNINPKDYKGRAFVKHYQLKKMRLSSLVRPAELMFNHNIIFI